MKDYKKKYYEQSEHWSKDFSKIPPEVRRVKEIIEVIHNDVQTILDVGCGSGFFLDSLERKKRYKKLVGLDCSVEALKYVSTEKVQGNIANLPFGNNSFDLVTCLEVLEHLPQEDFEKGILELQRVSKKNILITVPNEDDLARSLVMCPQCYCWFNPCFHICSFNEDKLQNLFNNFRLMKLKKIYLFKQRYYPLLLLTIYHYYKKPTLPKTAICPQCGYQTEKCCNQDTKFSFAPFFLFKFLAKLIWHPKTKIRWLLAFYEKK